MFSFHPFIYSSVLLISFSFSCARDETRSRQDSNFNNLLFSVSPRLGTLPWKADSLQHQRQTHSLAVGQTHYQHRVGVFLCTILRLKQKKMSCGSCLDHLEQCRVSRWFGTLLHKNAKALDLLRWPIMKTRWWQYKVWMDLLWAIESYKFLLKPTRWKSKTENWNTDSRHSNPHVLNRITNLQS